MAKIEYKVCVVTVTYGNRWAFLQQVLSRVLESASVHHVVLVDNASEYNLGLNIQQLRNDRVIVLRQEENRGSAGGYKAGIAYASELDIDLIWLLDDDNLPEAFCLQRLLDKWPYINNPDDRKALFCLREDRKQHIEIARGEDPYRFYLVPDNFLGFSLLRIIPNQIRKLNARSKGELPLQDARLPFTPYGGLLFHKSIIPEIGLPNEAFYLYVDDTDFSFRITESKGEIWLLPACKILDIDKSQGTQSHTKAFRSALLDNWNFRTYYHVRNMLYFNRKAIKNKYLHKVNKALYLACLYLISVYSCKREAFDHLLSAVHDGLSGNLGKKEF